jgi:hypothetical protein
MDLIHLQQVSFSPNHHIERGVVECPLNIKENYNVTYTNLTAVLTNVRTLIA